MEWMTPLLFFFSFFFNFRAAYKLLIDWRGMWITTRFVKDAYRRLDKLPAEEALEHDDRAPIFLHLMAAFQEPGIASTLRGLMNSRYPHSKIHYVVVTKEEEDRSPHPAMPMSTGELVRRFQAELPPYEQKLLTHLVMPGAGRKAHQLNWALRPETLREMLGEHYDPSRVFVAVSDADSVQDPNTYRWIAGEELAGRHSRAYQGVTLSLANFDRLNTRGRICAIQQSSIFIRVSIARLLNEVKRVRVINRLVASLPGGSRWLRPLLTFFFRRSLICLGHNQFIRLDTLQEIGGFPVEGATEDSTLGYALGMRGIVITAVPMLELNDLPETREKIIRQNARWYKGVLDDTSFLWRSWRSVPDAFNLAQLLRHLGNKVVEWPVAAVVYPLMGFLGWHLAYFYRGHFWLFTFSLAFPSIALLLTILVGGIMTQHLIEDLIPMLPKPLDIRRKTLAEKFLGTFRCQTYWLLATRGSWRVLYAWARTGRYAPEKTDRVIRGAEDTTSAPRRGLTAWWRSGSLLSTDRGVEQPGSSLGS